MHCIAGMPAPPSFSTFEKLLASTTNEGNDEDDDGDDDGERRSGYGSSGITNRVSATAVATAVGEISKEFVDSPN